MKDVVVAIPTYNEKDNVEMIVSRTLAVDSEISILVVDDNSPDGTGELADALAARHERVHVLHRAGKEGLGPAYRAAIQWARDHGFRYFAQMDADGSHHPEALPDLYAANHAGADLAIGSRWIPGGKTENWPFYRRWLSRGASIYASVMLRARIHDITAGFRIYRRRALQDWDLDTISSAGYCYQIEMSWRSRVCGLKITEVPITFTDRTEGVSKMSGGIIGEAFFQVFSWGINARRGKLPFPVTQPVPEPE